MKTLSLTQLDHVAARVVVSLAFAGLTSASAQQYQYPPGSQPQTYAPAPSYQQPNYQPQESSSPVTNFGARVKSTGQNVGNFVKRVFYGEHRSQPEYSQQPAYAMRGQSLDAPPVPQHRYSYAPASPPPPVSMPQPVVRQSAPPPVAPRKSTVAPTPKPKIAPAPAPVKSSPKRYTPAKPSTFSKPKTTPATKPAPVVRDEPPAPKKSPLSLPPDEPDLPSTTTEAKLNDTYPLPGGADMPASTDTSISPTLSDDPYIFKPQTSTKETASTTSATTSGGTSTSGSKSSSSFLTGKKTTKPGRVVSPYAPYNELDITGLPSGSLALDPTTQKVFQVP